MNIATLSLCCMPCSPQELTYPDRGGQVTHDSCTNEYVDLSDFRFAGCDLLILRIASACSSLSAGGGGPLAIPPRCRPELKVAPFRGAAPAGRPATRLYIHASAHRCARRSAASSGGGGLRVFLPEAATPESHRFGVAASRFSQHLYGVDLPWVEEKSQVCLTRAPSVVRIPRKTWPHHLARRRGSPARLAHPPPQDCQSRG